jgi:hypothetical protein
MANAEFPLDLRIAFGGKAARLLVHHRDIMHLLGSCERVDQIVVCCPVHHENSVDPVVAKVVDDEIGDLHQLLSRARGQSIR